MNTRRTFPFGSAASVIAAQTELDRELVQARAELEQLRKLRAHPQYQALRDMLSVINKDDNDEAFELLFELLGKES